MSGPQQGVKDAWKLIKQQYDGQPMPIKMNEPTEVNRYLGCKHDISTTTLPDKTVARSLSYNMEEFLTSSVKLYLEIAGEGTVLQQVDTPFVDEDDRGNPTRQPNTTGQALQCPWCAHTDSDTAFKPMQSKTSIKSKTRSSGPTRAGASDEKHNERDDPVSSGPTRAGQIDPTTPSGKLNTTAARILKVFYAARVARFDLLRAIGHLSCYLTKWTDECDRRLHQLMSYINCTLHHRMVGWLGDPIHDVQLHLYNDADFAGCNDTGRSTSGVWLALEGEHTSFPIAAMSKRQTSVSHSTPEAEIVDFGPPWTQNRPPRPSPKSQDRSDSHQTTASETLLT